MRKNLRPVCLSAALMLSAVTLVAFSVAAIALDLPAQAAQESFPEPPADRALIYVGGERNALAPLAVEIGTTPLRVEVVAKSDKRSYVEIGGEHSPLVITNIEPRFYLFLPEGANAKPPFLVRLEGKRGARRVTAMAQKGYKGFAIDSEEIIKPHYRVLAQRDGMQFVEFRPREPLLHGEYAIIGTDLQRIATFRVAAASNP